MKTERILFMILGITFFMLVVTPIASAQNRPSFGVWNGTLLKLKTTLKGYYYLPTTVNNLNSFDDKISENETLWGVVTGTVAGDFEIAIYSKGSSNQCVLEMILPMDYAAGSQLQFVAKFVVDNVDTYSSGLVYVDAQLDNTGSAIKNGGSLDSLAAYTIERGFDVPLDLAAGALTIKGKVVNNLGCTR